MAIDRFQCFTARVRREFGILMLLAIFGPTLDCSSQQPDSGTSTRADATVADASVSNLRAAGLKALQSGDAASAIKAADAMVRLGPNDPRTLRAAADLYLRGGKPDFAVRLFDRYLESRPDEMPYLWQRGIALYLTGDYQGGIDQFAKHRKVNPNDVENAAWHFLCVAKAYSIEEAKKRVLAAPGDTRVPMTEVHRMLVTGDSAAVTERIGQTPSESVARESAEFYGNVYLGLYADAMGRTAEAKELLDRAAKDAPRNYMGDVARVYAERFPEEPK